MIKQRFLGQIIFRRHIETKMQSKIFGLATLFLIISLIILIEQYLNYGIFFDLNDIHHETFALTSFSLTIGILIGSKLSKKHTP